MKKIVIAFLINLPLFNTLSAQESFPKGYFIMPINPGQATSLSGCFGDIRFNHFHSGLDVRTGGVEGKRVVAAADGYVSRISIRNGGYGNALYITHPNGYTTVYAHLRDFNNEISEYITRKQYEQKAWEIDIPVDSALFSYKKGELVAFSGNTGGSGGPHLHFEIRDSDENTIDPRLFGFKELTDRTPPIITLISLKTMSADATINGKFGIFNFTPVKSGSNYVIQQAIKATGLIGVEVLTYDRTANSPFRLGVKSINLDFNNKPAYSFNLEKMPFDNKVDMNLHVNYEKMVKSNQKIHKCYLEEANRLDLYETNEDWGKLRIQETKNTVKLTVKDSQDNPSTVNFNIIKDDSQTNREVTSNGLLAMITSPFLNIINNIRDEKVIINLENSEVITLDMTPSAGGGSSAVYDLDEGFPKSVFVGNRELALPVNFGVSLSNPKIKTANLIVDFTGALYENAYINVSVDDSELILHDDIIPLKGNIDIKWKKSGKINYPDKQKVYLDGAKRKYIGGEWDGNTISFKTREFGTYVTLYDFDPPVITPRVVNKDQLRFTISDKLSGINKIECFIDNEWVLMDYEYKTGAIWSRKSDKNKPFQGNLVLKITDNCNNTASYETTIE